MSEASNKAIQKAYIVRGGVPRMVLPDLAWVGGCSNSSGWPGRAETRPVTHEPCMAYVIMGAQKTIMMDTGHYGLWYSLDGQLDAVLKGRPLDYVFVSHQEIPHTGNLGRLLRKYPNAVAVGDVRDYHLFHPEVALDRLVQKQHGDRIDLGDREIVFLDAIWKDLSGTMWTYDTRLKLLFSADTFGYIHLHDENVCGTMFHEMPEQTLGSVIGRPALPFFGMRSRDQAARVEAFRGFLKQYPLEIITSGHTAPIMGAMVPRAIEKLLGDIASGGPRFLQSVAGADPGVGEGSDRGAEFHA
jgi:glyoxylase-like metal-dependent hydrolase (beta-lactamase superfamily II)